MRRAGVLVVVLVGALAGAGQGEPAEGPSTTQSSTTAPAVNRPKKASPEAQRQLEAVIKLLSQEFKEQGAVRASNDYFIENPIDDLSLEALLSALEKNLGGGARADAYVKWQLLGAFSGDELEGRQVTRLLKIYREAPVPAVLPGIAPNPALNAVLHTPNLDAVLKEMKDARAKVDAENAVIVEYRDALYEKLPLGPVRFEAGLNDHLVRAKVGCRPILGRVLGGIRGWTIVARPQEVNAMIGLVQRVGNQRGPEFYDQVQYNKDTKKPDYWEMKRFDGQQQIKTWLDEMQTLASQMKGQAGLKFRE